MNYCIIDGKSFDVCVTAINEYFNIMDTSNAGRAIKNARMIRDIIGTAVGHKVKFARKSDDEAGRKAYDELWDYMKMPRESVNVKMADGQSVIEYEAYCTDGSRDVEYIENGRVFWSDMELSFIPMECQYTPSDLEVQNG